MYVYLTTFKTYSGSLNSHRQEWLPNVHVRSISKRIVIQSFQKYILNPVVCVVFKVQIEIKQEDFCTRGKEEKNHKQECHIVQARYQQPHYTVLHIFTQVLFWTGNHDNHQNCDPFLLFYKCLLIFIEMNKKNQNILAPSIYYGIAGKPPPSFAK